MIRDETKGGKGDAMVETIAHLPQNSNRWIRVASQCAIAALFRANPIV
ncbi:hypothetical protein [Leptodesmis sichuanensis]|nr:hypothetical protein [Leptodesmis sichuanensis]